MTANTFGISVSTVSVVIRNVCETITQVMGPNYIKLPTNTREIADLLRGIENKYREPHQGKCMSSISLCMRCSGNQPSLCLMIGLLLNYFCS